MRWLARITYFDWERAFADEMVYGPFRRWYHRHEFMPGIVRGHRGTTVRDIVDFDVLGPLNFTALPQMAALFAYRHRAARRLLVRGTDSIHAVG